MDCGIFEDRLEVLQLAPNSSNDNSATPPGDMDTYDLLKLSQYLCTMIIVGELGLTLPSWEELNRLCSEIFRNAYVHVVPGGSLNLISLLREVFPEVNMYGSNNYDKNTDGNWITTGGGLEPVENCMGWN